MQIAKTVSEIRALIAATRNSGKTVGFIPTMGALHEGHLSLVRLSKAECDTSVVSIFVNPTQFAPSEDLEKYPKPIEQDIALLEQENTDILFLPSKEEMYPEGASTFVNIEGKVAEGFEAAIRPTHFRGVATVVASLFNIVRPDIAFFGQKDLQQVAVIKKMVRDLHFPLMIKVGETVREADGLAMSSRNRYLSAEEREEALILSRTLYRMKENILSEKDFDLALEDARKLFDSLKKKAVLDYLNIIDPETFHPLKSFKTSQDLAVIIAAKIGTTRLIDNVLINK